jgi:hypothetical protein
MAATEWRGWQWLFSVLKYTENSHKSDRENRWPRNQKSSQQKINFYPTKE